MAHGREDTQRRYPGPSFYDEALAALHDSTQDGGKIHIPTLARRILQHLLEVGLLHTADDDLHTNVRKVKWEVEGKEQELWIRFDTHRSFAGYLAVEVVDAPRSDGAILAATTAMAVAQPIDFEQLRETMRYITSPAHKEQVGKVHAFDQRLHEEGEDVSLEELREHTRSVLALNAKYRVLEPLPYVLSLIRDYKPEINTDPSEERWGRLKMVCDAINDFLEGLRRLQAALEYGTPKRNLVPAIKNPQRDVQAATLHDVDGLSTREIGERMGIPLPGERKVDPFPDEAKALEDLMKILKEKNKGEHQTVRKMVERGRRILEEAFGKEGWQERVEIMKAEKARWWSLSPEERAKERDIETEARQRAEDRCPRST